tara:strand:+ start:9160 stop:10914 length:1755 start_codon:yes stop_codon:yes gene_type:complete
MAESDVFVRFGADIDPLKKGLATASSKLDQFGAKGRETANVMGKVAVAAVAAGAAIGIKLVNDSLGAIDAQAKLAKQLSTSSASLAVLNRAADMSGISMKNIEQGAKNLEVALGEAAQGTGIAVDTLERLGLTAEQLSGMSLDDKILTVNAALKANIPVTERAAAAADLFGKRAGFAIMQLDPATLAEATRQVEGMGLAISDVDAAKIEAANDAMASIGMAVDGVVQQFTIALAPILEEIALGFQEAAIQSGGFKEEVVSAVAGIAKAFGFLGDSIRGVQIVIGGIEVALKGATTAIGVFAANALEYFERIRIGWAEIYNVIAATANNIPNIDMPMMSTDFTEFTQGVRSAVEVAKTDLIATVSEVNKLLLAPLPSETVDAFIASINDPRIIEAKQEQLAAIKALAEQDAMERIGLEERTQSAMAQIRQSWGKQQTQAVSQMFGDLSTLMQSGSKKQFEIGKAAARAQTVMSTYEGAQKAYTALAGIPIVGPALGIAAAGAAIAAGGIRLQAINSTSIGGGASVSGAAAGGGGTGASAPQQAAPAAQERNLTVSGVNPDQMFSGRQLIDIINSATEDGSVLRLA